MNPRLAPRGKRLHTCIIASVVSLIAGCGGGGGGSPEAPIVPPGPEIADNRPPNITSNAITDALENQAYLYDVDATDPDAGDQILFTLSQFPAGMAIDELTGVITWSPTAQHSGAHAVTVVATDTKGATDSQDFNVVVTSQPGSLRIVSPAVTNALQDQPYSYQVAAAGGDASEPYVFALTSAPSAMSINSATGQIAWQPGNSDVGSHPVEVTVTDAASASITQSFTIVVANVNDPPYFTWTPITQIEERTRFEHTVTASDPDAGDTLRFSLSKGPAGMSIDSVTGALTWEPGLDHVGKTHPVEISVRDSAAATAALAFDLEVLNINEKPSITTLPETAIQVDRLYTYKVGVTDPDPADSITYSLRQKPSGMSIDSTGQLSWVPTAGQKGAHTVIVRAADSGSPTLVVEQQFVIYVLDAIPKSAWSLKFVDSEEIVGENAPATAAFDGDPATFWHTKWKNVDPRPPHEIQIDLGKAYEIAGFRHLPRQDANINGRIKDYEFYVSENGSDWGSPAVAGQLVNSRDGGEVTFALKTGRYIRLVALSEINDSPWTTLAELDVIGTPFTGNFRPSGTIVNPAADLSVNVGDTVTFSGTASDRDNDGPLINKWSIDDSGKGNDWVDDLGSVSFSQPGTYVVRMASIDQGGRINSTPALRIVKVLDGSLSALLDRASWSVRFVDSAEPTGAALNALDGKVSTHWITQNLSGTPAELPHQIQINLGAAYAIDGFRYLPRQDGATLGNIKDYSIFVSEDGIDWGNPVTTGVFEDTAAEKRILFPPKFGQFVRLLATSEVGGNQVTAASEINVEGTCKTPYVRILSPQSFYVQSSTTLNIKASVCLKSDVYAGWGVKFVLDSGAKTKIVTTPPYEVSFSSLARAEHQIETFIVNAEGAVVEDLYSYDVVSSIGIGRSLVALGDSISFGTGDDDNTDDTSRDGRSVEGGFAPVLNDLLTSALGYPNFIGKAAVPGIDSAQMLERLPSVLSAQTLPIDAYLVQLGTNDSGGAFPVPSGLGLQPGDGGYAGSLKANLQDIIDLVTAAGPDAYLAKLPSSSSATRNAILAQYNLVIDELVVENGIQITPPDFFAHFQANPTQLASDGLHPNGEGYKAMANLWLNALTN